MGVPLDPLAPVEDDPPAPYGYAFDDPDNVAVLVGPRRARRRGRSCRSRWRRPSATTSGRPSCSSRSCRCATSPATTPRWPSRSRTPRAHDQLRAAERGEQLHLPRARRDALDRAGLPPGRVRRAVPRLAGDARRERARVHDAPEERARGGHAVARRRRLLDGHGLDARARRSTGAAAIHLYAPQFASPPGPPLDAFAYLPYTHAYFPQEHFDEVVTEGHWTFGRKGDGYVALWSWRPVRWRDHDPAKVFTHGLTQPFDLVADGGADNVWIVEVGDADKWKSFDAFRAAVRAGTGRGHRPRAPRRASPRASPCATSRRPRGAMRVRVGRTAHGEGRRGADRRLPPLRQPRGPRRRSRPR